MSKMIRFVLLFVLLLTGILPAAAQTETGAFVRAGHFIADAPAVDVYVNDQLVVENLSYGNVSVWMAAPSGTVTASITETGTQNVLATVEEVILEEGGFATLSAVGTSVEPFLQPVLEDYETPIQEGESRVTLFHAMSGMTGIDLVRDGVVLISTVAYPGQGNDGSAAWESAAGVYDVTVTGAGRSNAVLIDLPELELPSQGFISVFAFGTLQAPEHLVEVVTAEDLETLMSGGTLTDEMDSETADPDETAEPDAAATEEGSAAVPPVDAEFVYTEGDAAFVRAAHFAPDAPAVSLFFNNQLSEIQGIEYTDVTDWVKIPAGTYAVSVVPSGGLADEAVVIVEEVVFEADSFTTLSALGMLEDESLFVQPAVENYAAIEPGEARVSLFHAIPDMSGIDLVREGVVIISTVDYPDSNSDGMASWEVAAGNFNFAVTAAGRTNAVLFELPEMDIHPESFTSIFAYGTLEAPQYVIKVVDAADVAEWMED